MKSVLLKIFLIFPLIFFAFASFPSLVSALGVLARPDRLEIQSYLGRTASLELLVANNTNEPALYSVYADGLKKQITIEPENFKLEANETRSVRIAARFFWPGAYRTNISVLAKSLSAGDLSALPGLKVPLSVLIGGWSVIAVLAGLIIFCLGLAFALKYKGFKFKNKDYETAD